MEIRDLRSWRELPAAVELPPGVVDVCAAELDSDPRGDVSREFARAVFAAYLGAAEPRFADQEPGGRVKPRLAGPEQGWLRFNLSHSGRLVLCALARDLEVGADVEAGPRRTDAVAVARRAFGAAEADRLAALEPEQRSREFLRAWTRFEALAKCAGTGIGAGRAADLPDAARRAWTRSIQLGGDAMATVACEAAPESLRLWRMSETRMV